MDIITGDELASYLQTDPSDSITQLTGMVNDLISEEWRQPTDPAPTRVKLIAFEVARRAYQNPRGLSSWTRSVDNSSRTERLPEKLARAGVYLTDEEMRALNGQTRTPARSIALRVPGVG